MSCNSRTLKKNNTKPLQATTVLIGGNVVNTNNTTKAEQTDTRTQIEELERMFTRKINEAEQRISKANQEQYSILHGELKRKETEMEKQKKDIGNMEKEIKRLNDHVTQLSTECLRLTKELAEKDKALETSKRDQEILQKQLDLKTKELEISENERKKLQMLLDARTGALQGLMENLGTLIERTKISDNVRETRDDEVSDNKSNNAQVAKKNN